MNEIISYLEMCQREGSSLQRGMNFELGRNHSVVLMSTRPNAPYNDRIEDDGLTLIYEGHDISRRSDAPDPKTVDQPLLTPNGKLTQNGKFFEAAKAYKNRNRSPERVKKFLLKSKILDSFHN